MSKNNDFHSLWKNYAYCRVLFKWEFFIQMRASCLPLSFHQKRGATEKGWVRNWPFSFEWKALIWIGRHCSHSFSWSLKKLCFCCWFGKRRIFLPDETDGNAAVGDTLLSQVSVPLPGWAGYEVDMELSQLKFVNRTHFQFKVKVKSIDFIFSKSFDGCMIFQQLDFRRHSFFLSSIESRAKTVSR